MAETTTLHRGGREGAMMGGGRVVVAWTGEDRARC